MPAIIFDRLVAIAEFASASEREPPRGRVPARALRPHLGRGRGGAAETRLEEDTADVAREGGAGIGGDVAAGQVGADFEILSGTGRAKI